MEDTDTDLFNSLASLSIAVIIVIVILGILFTIFVIFIIFQLCVLCVRCLVGNRSSRGAVIATPIVITPTEYHLAAAAADGGGTQPIQHHYTMLNQNAASPLLAEQLYQPGIHRPAPPPPPMSDKSTNNAW